MRRFGTTTPFGTSFAAIPDEIRELPLDMLRSRAERQVLVEAIQAYQGGARAAMLVPAGMAQQQWKKNLDAEYRPWDSALRSYVAVMGERGRTLTTVRSVPMPAGMLPDQGFYQQGRGLPNTNLTPGALETLQAYEDFAQARAVQEKRDAREAAIAQARDLRNQLENLSRGRRY